MRRNGDKARDFAARHGVPKWYDNAADLYRTRRWTPFTWPRHPNVHAPNVLAAARAGKPVYVEKPMGRNHGECLAMIAACRGAGVPCLTAYYRRRLPRFLKVKEILDQGGIGEVRTVSVTLAHVLKPDFLRKDHPPWRVVPEIAGGGLFVDLASHTLDLLDFLLGPIAGVRGLATESRNPCGGGCGGGGVHFRFGGGGRQIVEHGGGHAGGPGGIQGTRGKLAFATFENAAIRWTSAAGERDFAVPNPLHIQQPLIQSIVDELNGEDVCPSTGESGARANLVMDAILGDFRAGAGA